MVPRTASPAGYAAYLRRARAHPAWGKPLSLREWRNQEEVSDAAEKVIVRSRGLKHVPSPFIEEDADELDSGGEGLLSRWIPGFPRWAGWAIPVAIVTGVLAFDWYRRRKPAAIPPPAPVQAPAVGPTTPVSRPGVQMPSNSAVSPTAVARR